MGSLEEKAKVLSRVVVDASKNEEFVIQVTMGGMTCFEKIVTITDLQWNPEGGTGEIALKLTHVNRDK